MKKITSHLISFILTISIFLLSILLTLSCTILNESYILKKFQEINYYEKVHANIVSNFENNLIQIGLDKEINNLVSKNQVEEDIKGIITSIYHNQEIKINKELLKSNIEHTINSIFETNNRIPSSLEKENINNLTNNLISIYEDEILYFNNLIVSLPHTFRVINTIINVIETILVLIILNLFAITIFIVKSKKSIGTSLLASGLINVFLKVLVGNSYQQILIFNKVFSETFINLINSILNHLLVEGIILIIIGLIISIYNKLQEES